MSELRTDTITASDGTSPVTLTKQSAAKAWASVNGTGTIAIRDSFNIASIADVATGRCGVTLSSSLSSAEYSATVTGKASSDVFLNTSIYGGSTPTASRYDTVAGNTSAALDIPYIFSAVHGDLA